MPYDMNPPKVIIDIPRRIAVGIATDFSVTFKAGGMGGTMVIGEGEFPSGDYSAQYYDTSDGTWKDFPPGSNQFGPSGGFPLVDATSSFRVTFNTPSVGTFSVKMKSVSTGSVLASDSVSVVAATGETVDELNARIAAAAGGTITLETDVKGTVRISNDVTLNGAGHTLHGNIILASDGDTIPYTVAIRDLDMRDDDGSTSAKGYGIYGQNQTADKPVKPVNLTVSGCSIHSYSKKGIYLTNPLSFNLMSCTIGDVATDPVNDPNTYGDYAVDLNICGVQNSKVRIIGNTFTGSCGANGAVKVAQRGGIVSGKPLTDDVNTDILNPVSATVASCIVSGNDFSAMRETRSEGAKDIVLGSSANSDGSARTYNNSYPAQVGASTETLLAVRGSSEGDMLFAMPSGSEVSVSSVRGTDGKYLMTIDTSADVTFSGTMREGAALATQTCWMMPESGPTGVGMLGLQRLLIRADSVTYHTGGLPLPTPFSVYSAVVNVKGGADAWVDPATGRILMYRGGAEVAEGTSLTDVTVLLIGPGY